MIHSTITTRLPVRVLHLLASTLLLLASPVHADVAASMEAATAMDVERARILLRDAPEGDYRDFAEALLLLNRQPRTAAAMIEARERFSRLGSQAAEEGLRAVARYLEARVLHVHQFRPDFSAAAAAYEALFRDHPNQPAAQVGLARLAMIRLYDSNATKDEQQERFAALAEMGAGIDFQPAKRDFHYVMGVAAAKIGLAGKDALHHMQAAAGAGFVQDKGMASIQMRIGEVALELGKIDVARSAFTRFLEENVRDPRGTLVRERLESLNDVQ